MASVPGVPVKYNTECWCVPEMLPMATGTIGLAGKIIIKDSTKVPSVYTGLMTVLAGLPNNETGSLPILSKAYVEICPSAVETGVNYAGETVNPMLSALLDTVAAPKAGAVYSGEPGLLECTV